MSEQKIIVPDIGGAEGVDVIEILVKEGDTLALDDPLITLESDKASMDVPSPVAGKVKSIAVKMGDKVSEGDLILTVSAEASTQNSDVSEPKKVSEPKSSPISHENTEKNSESNSPKTPHESAKKISAKEILIPDLGGAKNVDVIEVLVKVGDSVEKDASLVTLESDKASMDIPSPYSGKIADIKIKKGDKVNQGQVIALINTEDTSSPAQSAQAPAPVHTPTPTPNETISSKVDDKKPMASSDKESIYAGPAVRRLARELDISLTHIQGSGEKGRVTRDDVKQFVKNKMHSGGGSGLALPSVPAIDFTRFGEVETQPLSKIKKLSGANLHRNWVTIPHITQFEEADITEMEAFRQAEKKRAEEKGCKLTPIVFVMKAVVAALKEYPIFNASLDSTGEHLILKKYFHLGVAVDTPNGLVVPVIRDVDKKSLFELAKELADISAKARDKGLSLTDMQGSCFTISSLGGIGGTAFTPIVNAPDVAILGVSKSAIKPVFDEASGNFKPRLMLPLSLSYDHRVIDGADGARFAVFLARCLSDIRTLLL